MTTSVRFFLSYYLYHHFIIFILSYDHMNYINGIYNVVTDVVNDVTYSHKNVNTRVHNLFIT